MDGHGFYIWMAYGITFFVLLLNLYWPKIVRGNFIRKEKQIQARETNHEADVV